MFAGVIRRIALIFLYRQTRHQGRLAATDLNNPTRAKPANNIIEILGIAGTEGIVVVVVGKLIGAFERNLCEFFRKFKLVKKFQLGADVEVKAGDRSLVAQGLPQIAGINNRFVIVLADGKYTNIFKSFLGSRKSYS